MRDSMLFRTNDIVVLNIDSKRISAIVASSKSQGVYFVKSFSETAYSGFEDSCWFDEGELKSAVRKSLAKVLDESSSKAKTLYISVPAEFSTIVTREVPVFFDRKRKISSKDINFLVNKGKNFQSQHNFQFVSAIPLWFKVDDDNRKMFDATGCFASKVSAGVNYVLAQNEFVKTMESLAKEFSFLHAEFISSDVANGISLLDDEQRTKDCLILNIGYLSTSVSTVKGNGLIDMKFFSKGIAHVEAKVFEAFEDVPFEIIEEAVSQIDLNLAYGDEDYIITSDEGGFVSSQISELVKDGLDEMLEEIACCIEAVEYDMESPYPIYLIGEGITDIRGAVRYIEEAFGKQVEILQPKLPLYNKPKYSTIVSLLMVASKLEKKKHRLLNAIESL